MIVDDSDLILRLLTDMVNDVPGTSVVATARNGEEAIALAQQHEPDFVSLDLRMPHQDGFEVLRRLKSQHHPPVVAVLTNFPFARARRRCASLGADFVLDKMEETHKLADILRDAVAGHDHGISSE